MTMHEPARILTPDDFLDQRPAVPGGEAAPGVARHDVEAVNAPAKRTLYATRAKIYPRLAHGRFRTLKWLMMAVALGIYYVLPWLRWDRGSSLPNQAVLADVEHGRLYFFFLEIWPQELYYVTGLLVLSALALFLVTSMAGRVWCGYACPQTVWTDLMVAVERLWQGDRNARIRLDKQPWDVDKFMRKTMTHLTWVFIGVMTGGALVFYFRDAPTLAKELISHQAPAAAYLFLGIFTTTTYLLGGIAREQVCIYMCPWPRIQGAMIDRHTLLVSYRTERGEPRGPVRKGPDGKPNWQGRGDCIDCKACVAVCPTGIDIRDGAQLECIQCALCIDACAEIMNKIGRPRGLIAYDTIAKQEAQQKGQHEPLRLLRPRTILYAGLIAVVTAIMLLGYANRTLLEVNVLRDRGAMFTRLSDGGVRNSYTVKVLNKLGEPREVLLGVEGLADARMTVIGRETEAAPRIAVEADDVREVRVLITIGRDAAGAMKEPSVPVTIFVTDPKDNRIVKRQTVFQGPGSPAR